MAKHVEVHRVNNIYRAIHTDGTTGRRSDHDELFIQQLRIVERKLQIFTYVSWDRST